jgi:hypothetical protein
MNVLHWSDVSLPAVQETQTAFKNTPEGDVEIYYKGLLFLYRTAQGTHTIFKTHQRVL